jgi:short-subunit dehydrogenase
MPFALITGASNGIGLCLAKELAAKKYDLLLVSRDEVKLKSLQQEWQSQFKITVEYLSLDLSLPDSPSKVGQWVAGRDVEILINNAGFGLWGEIETSNSRELSSLIQLNQVTLVELCQHFIPRFKARKSKSYILNVASTAAYQAVPFLAVYSASKAFVLSFTRALRWELKDTSISVSCLSPGTTSTGFMDRAHMNDSLKQKAEKFTMSAEEVARIGLNGMFNGKSEIIPGFINWFSAKMVSFVPKKMTEQIAYNLYKSDSK